MAKVIADRRPGEVASLGPGAVIVALLHGDRKGEVVLLRAAAVMAILDRMVLLGAAMTATLDHKA